MDNSKIEKYYSNNNYPSAGKLFKILKTDNINISLKKIKEWLAKQEVELFMKPVKRNIRTHNCI